MSGIKIAGLVLGALPVMISALQNYKAGQGAVASLMTWRSLLDASIHRLQHARCIFSLKIETLLRAAGIRIDGQNLQDGQYCIRILMNERVARELKKYLRSFFDKFQSVIRKYENCLKLIAAELKNIERLPNMSQLTRPNKHCDQLMYIDCE